MSIQYLYAVDDCTS